MQEVNRWPINRRHGHPIIGQQDSDLVWPINRRIIPGNVRPVQENRSNA